MLYSVFIFPLESLLLKLYSAFLSIGGNAGLSLVLLSFTVSLFMAIVALWGKEAGKNDAAKKVRIATALKSIAGVENRREKYYYTKEIYRIYGYRQWHALNAMLPLIIQIPFFLAAYFAFHGGGVFRDCGFWIIKDLSTPDRMILGINILPVIMTGINISGVVISRKGRSRIEIVESLMIAVFFLILLYEQPAGLVLYWSFNNIFSIIRDLYIDGASRRASPPQVAVDLYKRTQYFFKGLISHKAFFFSAYIICTGMMVSSYAVSAKSSPGATLILKLALLMLTGLLASHAMKFYMRHRSRHTDVAGENGVRTKKYGITLLLFFWLFLVFLLSQGYRSSFWPGSYGVISLHIVFIIGCWLSRDSISHTLVPHLEKPAQDTRYSMKTAVSISALFVVTIFSVILKLYLLNPGDFPAYTSSIVLPITLEMLFVFIVLIALIKYFSKTRTLVLFVLSILTALAICYGSISAKYTLKNFLLEDASMLSIGNVKRTIETYAIVQSSVLFWYFIVVRKENLIRREKALRIIAVSISCALMASLGYYGIKNHKAFNEVNKAVKERDLSVSGVRLSKKNNTIVILLDGFPGNLMAKLRKERPELFRDFKGFTWYPDSISLGAWTWNGAPALYGGAVYSPDKLIKSSGKLVYTVLDDTIRKHTQKGRMVNFYNEPFFKSKTKDPLFNKYNLVASRQGEAAAKFRNALLNLALMQISPFSIKAYIYNDGRWALKHYSEGTQVADPEAKDRYDFIKKLPELDPVLLDEDTIVSYIYTYISHGPYSVLEDGTLGKTASDDFWNAKGQENAAVLSFTEIAHFLRNLSSLGLYESSQIVIVSDHGNPGIQKSMTRDSRGILEEIKTRGGWYDCLLMYKAPGSTGELKTDDSLFMTNADVPELIEAGMKGESAKFLFEMKPGRILKHYIQYNNYLEKEITEIEMRGTSMDTSAWIVKQLSAGDFQDE